MVDTTNSFPEFGTPRDNEERRDGGCGVVFDPITQKYAVGEQFKDSLYRLFSGGVDLDEDLKEGILREVREESGLTDFLHVEKIAEALTHYHNNLRQVNRVAHATCYLIILRSSNLHPTKLEAHEKFLLKWTTVDDILQNWEKRNQKHDYDHWIYFLKKAVSRAIDLGYDTTTGKELVQ